MKVLTVRQPYAWLLIHGGKDIENRSYRTSHRGPLLIQASARSPRAYFDAAMEFARSRGISIPVDSLRSGSLSALVELVDCVSVSASPWFNGPVGWVVRNALPVDFIAFRGRLTIFEAPSHVVKSLKIR